MATVLSLTITWMCSSLITPFITPSGALSGPEASYVAAGGLPVLYWGGGSPEPASALRTHTGAHGSRSALDIAEDFLVDAEGFVLTAYQDVGGVWTIGAGHTGPEVHEGMTITPAQAFAYLRQDAKECLQAVRKEVDVHLNPYQEAALCAFIYNVGLHAFRTSYLLELLNQGQYAAVPHQLMRWVHVDGERVRGLVNRRKAEVRLWKHVDTLRVS